MTTSPTTKFPQPFYFLTFSITDKGGNPCQFSSLFSAAPESLRTHLESKGSSFRYAGWGIPHHISYAIGVDGIEFSNNLIRVKFVEDGHILIQAAVSEDFLCWANSSRQSSRKGERIQLNTTALIEFTYNCVLLLKRALEDCPGAENVICEFGFMGMTTDYVLGDEKLPGGSFTHSSEYKPIGSITESKISTSPGHLAGVYSPGIVSFDILSRIYRMFGYGEETISFVTDRMIDPKLISGE